MVFLIFIGFLICGAIWWHYRSFLSYQDYDIIIKSFSCLTPFVAAYAAYYTWSRNREKELKNIDYKHDYYKKILDLRISAYRDVGNLLFLMEQEIELASEKDLFYHHLYSNQDCLDEVCEQIKKIAKNKIFLNDDTITWLFRINHLIRASNSYLHGNNRQNIMKFLAEYNSKSKQLFEKIDEIESDFENNKIIIGEYEQKAYVVFGIALYKEVKYLCDAIKMDINQSLLSLPKVKYFLKNRGINDK